MDNLSMDSTRAIEAGMSYGQWKALHPFTKHFCGEEIEWRYIKECQRCFKKFGTNRSRKKFCSEECRMRPNISKTNNKSEKEGAKNGKRCERTSL